MIINEQKDKSIGFVSVGNYSLSIEQMQSLKTILGQERPSVARRCDSSYADLEFEAFAVQCGCRSVQYVTSITGKELDEHVLEVLEFESPEQAMMKMAEDSDTIIVALPKKVDDTAAKIGAVLGSLDMGRTKTIHVISYAGKVTRARKIGT